jgi:hypothetical protein
MLVSHCGLPRDTLLLMNNYSKHIYWIFINGLSFAEVCLRVAAKNRDLIAPITGLNSATQFVLLQASECHGSELVNAACAASWTEMRNRMRGGELGRGQRCQ